MNQKVEILSVRENPNWVEKAIQFFQQAWPGVWPSLYEDSIRHSLCSENPLPQWYLLVNSKEIIGCAGLITNDFISRMDLYPWICALYIEESFRGNNLAKLLIEKAISDAKNEPFRMLLVLLHLHHLIRNL